MSYLFFCALVSLIFGLLFLVSPDVLGTMGSVFNAGLFTIDSSIMRYRLWLGGLLIAIAAWIFYVGLQFSSWYIIASWIIALGHRHRLDRVRDLYFLRHILEHEVIK